MITYRIQPELHLHKELGFYIAFGIRATCKRRAVFTISDVFLRRRQAKAFAALCNREQPEWVHIPDIIEDAI